MGWAGGWGSRASGSGRGWPGAALIRVGCGGILVRWVIGGGRGGEGGVWGRSRAAGRGAGENVNWESGAAFIINMLVAEPSAGE